MLLLLLTPLRPSAPSINAGGSGPSRELRRRSSSSRRADVADCPSGQTTVTPSSCSSSRSARSSANSLAIGPGRRASPTLPARWAATPSLCLPLLLLVVTASLCSCTCCLPAVLKCHDGVDVHACEVSFRQARSRWSSRLLQGGHFCCSLSLDLGLHFRSLTFTGVEFGL